jgi:hypothetical protein
LGLTSETASASPDAGGSGQRRDESARERAARAPALSSEPRPERAHDCGQAGQRTKPERDLADERVIPEAHERRLFDVLATDATAVNNARCVASPTSA